MKKIDKLIVEIEKLYNESNEKVNSAAMGYDEGYYSGEATAYAEVLSLLKESNENKKILKHNQKQETF